MPFDGHRRIGAPPHEWCFQAAGEWAAAPHGTVYRIWFLWIFMGKTGDAPKLQFYQGKRETLKSCQIPFILTLTEATNRYDRSGPQDPKHQFLDSLWS